MGAKIKQESEVSFSADAQTPIEANYPVNFSGSLEVRRLLFSPAAFQRRMQFGLRTEIAQGYGIVIPGLILARHIFQGLRRGVHDESGEDQGPKKLIYSWTPIFDCLWLGDRFSGRIERVSPPPNRVFVVIVSPNSAVKVGTPAGLVERWNWVQEDQHLKGAPVSWQERYGQKLWSMK